MRDLIITEVRRLGFAAVGFARASQSESMAVYREWLDAGYAGGMEYLHRHAALKEHPANVAPGVKTIIAVAARYPTNPTPGTGFSTSARGLDYHDVIRAKLRQLSQFINDQCSLEVHRICVDSAPLLEREWAVRAGLGWLGRQGQLVNADAGCCLLLGFLLIDLALDSSHPVPNQCGGCRLCLESCPTGALLGDGHVDARRCISYLTIEPGAEISAELAEKMQGALFGCDCCTSICPWNKTAAAPIMPEFQETIPLPRVPEIMHWNKEDFKARFKGTSVYRTGLEHLQRNAQRAASNF